MLLARNACYTYDDTVDDEEEEDDDEVVLDDADALEDALVRDTEGSEDVVDADVGNGGRRALVKPPTIELRPSGSLFGEGVGSIPPLKIGSTIDLIKRRL